MKCWICCLNASVSANNPRIFGEICKLSLQALDSTQSTIFACLQASSLQLSLESSRIRTKVISAIFSKSPIKRLAVHKVQPALALLVQLRKIRSNLQGLD